MIEAVPKPEHSVTGQFFVGSTMCGGREREKGRAVRLGTLAGKRRLSTPRARRTRPQRKAHDVDSPKRCGQRPVRRSPSAGSARTGALLLFPSPFSLSPHNVSVYKNQLNARIDLPDRDWLFERPLFNFWLCNWRHKLLNALKQMDFEKFEGIVEIDETYFLYSQKGQRGITERNSQKRGELTKLTQKKKDWSIAELNQMVANTL
ncbi:hypothetical protein CB4_03289 [Aneurinibacillus soli]|uniref:Uncharacterized protein n=1 Tax=Aneurinibacillus soli TaxID=1500254 RepID=A0A0U5BFP8_9BACL|nr:hypothetical protein CB4_03289 [Aneurinibacillus soli]